MNAPDHANRPPVTPSVASPTHPEFIDLSRRLPASKIATPLRTLALCIGSIAVMTPWPLLGILLMQSLFDKASEAFFFFGGITMFPLMILALFGSPSEEVLISLFMLVWVAAAVVPDSWLRQHGTFASDRSDLGSAETTTPESCDPRVLKSRAVATCSLESLSTRPRRRLGLLDRVWGSEFG